MTNPTKPLTYASRAEIEVQLQCFEGTVPNDLSGFAWFNSPVGTVNYETPIPKLNPDGTPNPEWGQMIFNGDGMVFRFDMSTQGQISVKSSLLRTPCFFADEASKMGTGYYNSGMRFDSAGMARTSMVLGSRNQANTSLNGFRLSADQKSRLTVNFDAGRPFEIDPVSMQLITPIGYNSEWRQELPELMQNTFELFQATAHPSFDPETFEFFTLCFTKDAKNLFFYNIFGGELLKAESFLVDKIKGMYDDVLSKLKLSADEFLTVLQDFSSHAANQLADPTLPDYSPQQAVNAVQQNAPSGPLGMVNEVTLMRWTGAAKLDQWNIVDEQGQNLVILQTMHQTSFTKDYILLCDTSLKVTLDILFNVPFPDHPLLSDLLRFITTHTLQPQTPLYIINRADLIPGQENVKAVKTTIPLEMAHFSTEYQNPNGQITLYGSHNTALCASEWIRPFDTLAIDSSPVLDNTIGLFCCGEMDISRTGKFVIDGQTGLIKSQQIIYNKGFDGNDPTQLTSAHTWAVGVSTYLNSYSAYNNTNTIPQIFWQFYGLDYRMLTTFIKNLYSNWQNRAIPVADLLSYTKTGVPMCLSRQDTSDMSFPDWYMFQMNEILRSIQFVPKKVTSASVTVDDSHAIPDEMNGYILCTMVVGSPTDLTLDEYTREIWIFDAANLAAGPVCKLYHPDLQFAFTIHSTWIPEIVPSPRDYSVDIVADYKEVINQFPVAAKTSEMLTFLEATVFPHYPSTT